MDWLAPSGIVLPINKVASGSAWDVSGSPLECGSGRTNESMSCPAKRRGSGSLCGTGGGNGGVELMSFVMEVVMVG